MWLNDPPTAVCLGPICPQFKRKCRQASQIACSSCSPVPTLLTPFHLSAPSLSPPFHLSAWNTHYLISLCLSLSLWWPTMHKSNLTIFTTDKFNHPGLSPYYISIREAEHTSTQNTNISFRAQLNTKWTCYLSLLLLVNNVGTPQRTLWHFVDVKNKICRYNFWVTQG